MFKRLTLASWRQFELVEIDFDPNLTILTGSNGSGKTAILHLLSAHYEWQMQFVSTPRRTRTGQIEYSFDRWEEKAERIQRMQTRTRERLAQLPSNAIGRLEFTDGMVGTVLVQGGSQPSYQPRTEPFRQVPGLHITSHRPVYNYAPARNIPTQYSGFAVAYQRYSNVVRSAYAGQQTESPTLAIKEMLIALATFGPGNQHVEPNPEAEVAFTQFQAVLRKVLPPTLGFESLSIRLPEVVLITKTGDFSLDAVSGGIASIIDLAWRIFSYERSQSQGNRFIVTIDEPENHLHPSMQQSLLPNFVDAFPRAQFIVATHSPFIISSLPDSSVYALRYENEKITSIPLSTVDKAGTANDILREILGLPFTMPLWADKRLQEIVAKYSVGSVTDDSLAAMRVELKSLGLEDYIPKAVTDVVTKGVVD